MTKEERVSKTAHLIVDRWLYSPHHSRYREAMHIIEGWLTTFAAEIEEAQRTHGPCHGPEDCPQAELEEKIRASEEIRTAEKKILLAEIEKNANLQAKVCAMREALQSARESLFAWNSMGIQPEAVIEEMNRLYTASPEIQLIDQALSSAPQCPHKEGRIKAEESYEKYRNEALKWHRVAGEREYQIAALLASLDVANGKVMEWEHRAIGFHCGPCEKCNRSREDWTKAARERREVR